MIRHTVAQRFDLDFVLLNKTFILPNLLRFSLSGLDEIQDKLPKSVSHVVSLVDPYTVLPSSLNLVSDHNRLVLYVHDALDSQNGLRAPKREDVLALCHFADNLNIAELSHLLIHCHMGRSRSAAAAAILLLRLKIESSNSVFQRLLKVRNPIWPNWTLVEHGDSVLSCNGELMHACEILYKQMQQNFPKWVSDPCPENI